MEILSVKHQNELSQVSTLPLHEAETGPGTPTTVFKCSLPHPAAPLRSKFTVKDDSSRHAHTLTPRKPGQMWDLRGRRGQRSREQSRAPENTRCPRFHARNARAAPITPYTRDCRNPSFPLLLTDFMGCIPAPGILSAKGKRTCEATATPVTPTHHPTLQGI